MSFKINSSNKTLNPENLLPGFDAAQLFQTPLDPELNLKISNNGVLQWDSQNQVWTTGTGPFDPSGNLNLECGNIKEVTGLEFCDGTFIGTTGPTGTPFQIESDSVLFSSSISSGTGLQITIDNTSSALIDNFNQLYILGNNIGIGTTGPNPSALVDISSTTKGFLLPRMTAVEANAIVSPAEGLLVYVTTTGGIPFNFTSKGWWGYNGATWVQLG